VYPLDIESIVISFSDNGSEFDLTSSKSQIKQTPEMLRGRGIHLIKHYAESISYKRDKNLNLLKVVIGDIK